MAENPFAQFARPQQNGAANPFAQFAAPAPAPAPRAPEMPPMQQVEPSYASSMPDMPLEQETRLPRMSAREIGRGAAATGQAFGEGVIAGIPGVVGDIESLGRTAVNQLQRPEILRRALGVAGPVGPLALGASRIGPVEQETAFPTSGQVARGVFGESEAPAGETIREVGSIFSPLGTVARGIGRAGRAALESPLVGRPTAEQARVAAEAEAAGLRVRPRQVRETEPGTEMLEPLEQRQINREANRAIGINADAFDSAAVQQATRRFNDEYRRLYGRQINVDQTAANVFQQIMREERALDPSGSYKVGQTARNFLARYQAAQKATPPGQPFVVSMPGEDVRRLRSGLADFASRTEDDNMAFAARELVKRIDAMIERSNPQVARELQRVNQQYRAFMDLREMRRTNAGNLAVSGNISPQAVGDFLTANEALVSTSQRAPHPLRRIGEYGMQLGFRSRTEGAEAKADALQYLLTRPMRLLRAGLSPAVYPYELAARAVQRRMTPGGPPPTVTPRAATEVARGAAAAGRAVTEREE